MQSKTTCMGKCMHVDNPAIEDFTGFLFKDYCIKKDASARSSALKGYLIIGSRKEEHTLEYLL